MSIASTGPSNPVSARPVITPWSAPAPPPSAPAPSPDATLLSTTPPAAPAASAKKKWLVRGAIAGGLAVAAAVGSSMSHSPAPLPTPPAAVSTPVASAPATPPAVVTPAPTAGPSVTSQVRLIGAQNVRALQLYMNGAIPNAPTLTSATAAARFDLMANFLSQDQSQNPELTPAEKLTANQGRVYLGSVNARAQAAYDRTPETGRAPFNHFQAAVIVSDFNQTHQTTLPGLYVAAYELGSAVQAGR